MCVDDGPAGLNRRRVDRQKVGIVHPGLQHASVEIKSSRRVGGLVGHPGHGQGAPVEVVGSLLHEDIPGVQGSPALIHLPLPQIRGIGLLPHVQVSGVLIPRSPGHIHGSLAESPYPGGVVGVHHAPAQVHDAGPHGVGVGPVPDPESSPTVSGGVHGSARHAQRPCPLQADEASRANIESPLLHGKLAPGGRMGPTHSQIRTAQGSGAPEIHETGGSLVFPHRQKSGDLVCPGRVIQGTCSKNTDAHPSVLRHVASALGHGSQASHAGAHPNVGESPVGVTGRHGDRAVVLHDGHVAHPGNHAPLPS